MKKEIENLINYEIKQGVITKRDYIYVKNQLYNLLNMEVDDCIEPSMDISTPSQALNPILSELVNRGMLVDSVVSKDLFDSKLMNVFAPLPSSLQHTYDTIKTESKKKATEYLYKLAIALNYIRMDRILKNKSFHYKSNDMSLQITINLSKPEKNPLDIVIESKALETSYPKCVLCKENEGFAGNHNRDSRHQHRLIELDINNTTWYFQYSPYIYYNEHAIVLSKEHTPMKISQQTFENLFALVDQFDGYFFGSNADLPIVGGSILSHDHYQGGCHKFPIENAKKIKSWTLQQATISILDWPLSTLRLQSPDQRQLVTLATIILNTWKAYSHPELNIKAFSNGVPHNTITPVARYKNSQYELDLVLRNNQTSDEHPLGIFHPHSDKHHIKKENIGLIEAMGLAVLPARLLSEINQLKKYYFHHESLSHQASTHKDWFDTLTKQNHLTESNFDQIIEFEIGRVFERVLIDCGVFKHKDSDKFIDFVEAIINERLS